MRPSAGCNRNFLSTVEGAVGGMWRRQVQGVRIGVVPAKKLYGHLHTVTAKITVTGGCRTPSIVC